MNNKISNGINYIKKNLFSIIFIAFMLVLPVLSFAQDTKIFNPLGDNTQTLSGFVEKILKGVIKIGMPIIVLAIIYSGFLFVSAQGNSEKLSEAKRALLYTLIGAAILLGSWAIALLIRDTVLAL